MFFYNSVAGWVYSYLFKILTGRLRQENAKTAGEAFERTVIGPFTPILWQTIVLKVVSVIGYVVKKNSFREELSNQNRLDNYRLLDASRFILRYVTPVLLLLVFLYQLGWIRVG